MRKLNGESIITEVTLQTAVDKGYIGITTEGYKCFVPIKVVSQNGMKVGGKLTGALVPHNYSSDCDWFAEWVVDSRLVTTEDVLAALEDLKEGGAIRACDLGIHEGDILFHAGLAQKLVGFDRKQDIDAGKHIAYTIELDAVMDDLCVEFEDGEGDD